MISRVREARLGLAGNKMAGSVMNTREQDPPLDPQLQPFHILSLCLEQEAPTVVLA